MTSDTQQGSVHISRSYYLNELEGSSHPHTPIPKTYLGAYVSDHSDRNIELVHRGRGEVLDKEIACHKLHAAHVLARALSRLQGLVEGRHRLNEHQVVLDPIRLRVGGNGGTVE